MRRNDVVKKISDMMKLHFPEVETILYGSEARGTARPDSDIDLLILFPDNTESLRTRSFAVGDKLFELELETGVNISSITYKVGEWGRHRTPFYCNVVNEGIRI